MTVTLQFFFSENKFSSTNQASLIARGLVKYHYFLVRQISFIDSEREGDRDRISSKSVVGQRHYFRNAELAVYFEFISSFDFLPFPVGFMSRK